MPVRAGGLPAHHPKSLAACDLLDQKTYNAADCDLGKNLISSQVSLDTTDTNVSKGLSFDQKASLPTSIKNAFGGTSVFITGATGYIGSVILEQLLHRHPDISKVNLCIVET